MAISENKRRYFVTLTPANVERFQTLCKKMKLPTSTMSAALDDTLVDLCEIFQVASDRGTTGIVNLLKERQQEFNLQLNEEEKCSKCGKAMHKFHDCVLNPTATPNSPKEKKNDPKQKRNTSAHTKKTV